MDVDVHQANGYEQEIFVNQNEAKKHLCSMYACDPYPYQDKKPLCMYMYSYQDVNPFTKSLRTLDAMKSICFVVNV